MREIHYKPRYCTECLIRHNCYWYLATNSTPLGEFCALIPHEYDVKKRYDKKHKKEEETE